MFVREMGASARFALYALACLVLAAIDARYDALSVFRSGLNGVIHPAQKSVALPFEFLNEAAGFFVVHGELKQDNTRLVQERSLLQAKLQDYEALKAENERLRTLAGLPVPAGVERLPAEIIQTAANPFSRKVIVNRGSAHGVIAGRPVVDENGLVGQVTRVYPWSSEVTLITDRGQASPVVVVRNGLRLLVSGMGSDSLIEVRYLDMHADLKAGDMLTTSGVDGVYPPGLPVARVLKTEPPRLTPFARALCQPLSGVGHHRHMVILLASSTPHTGRAAVSQTDEGPATHNGAGQAAAPALSSAGEAGTSPQRGARHPNAGAGRAR